MMDELNKTVNYVIYRKINIFLVFLRVFNNDKFYALKYKTIVNTNIITMVW